MEDPLSKGVTGIADIVSQKWYAAMGLTGLLLFAATFVIPVQIDAAIVRSIALIMLGWGFGLTECRKVRKTAFPIARNIYHEERDVWQWTITGGALFAVASCAALFLAIRLTQIGWAAL